MSTKQGRRPRRQFDDDFRAQAIRLVLDEGKTVGAVARELDLTPSALATWVKQPRADRTKGKTGLTTEERAELARLRKDSRFETPRPPTSAARLPHGRTGDPRSIARGPRFDCDRDVTEQAGPPSEERCHNVATTGVDSGGLQGTGGDDRMAGR